jgi:hypothetical protein
MSADIAEGLAAQRADRFLEPFRLVESQVRRLATSGPRHHSRTHSQRRPKSVPRSGATNESCCSSLISEMQLSTSHTTEGSQSRTRGRVPSS